MLKTISVSQFLKKPDTYLDCVDHDYESFIIKRNGEPAAALVTMEKLRLYNKLTNKILDDCKKNERDSLVEDIIMEFVNEAVHEVRKERRKARNRV